MKPLKKDNVKFLKIITKNFGSVLVYLKDDENKIGNGYYVTATKKKKHLAGFIDLEGNEIIPFQEMELIEMFHTLKYQDICFGFQVPNTEILEYYHIQKQEDGYYRLILKTNPFDQVPLAIRQVKENSTFWIFEAIKENPEYAVYSTQSKKILTNFFDEISFDLEENPNHYLYFCKYIYSDRLLEGETSSKIIHTSLCGFLDKNGDFSSQILETETGMLYNSYVLGGNSLSDKFKFFIENLKNTYSMKYAEKEELIDETIQYLFNHSNLSEPTKVKSYKTDNIIEFKKKDK